MIRGHVVGAVFRRNFGAYFRSPTGYVFITVFIILSAGLAFCQDQFFTGNLANLDPLNRYFPFLLLFFVPAVTMSLWAEERRQGTDELLLTLPARDVELLLGKYLAALGIYSVSLAFALSHVGVLWFLGRPDWGVMAGTYLGYWLLGAALLSVGSVASLLTSSMTVAFVVGAIFCMVPVVLSHAGAIFSGRLETWLEGLGVRMSFGDLTSGVLPLHAVVYFVSLAAVMLYVNMILLTRRHSRGGAETAHHWTRAALLLAAAVGLGVLAGRAGWRADLTEERIHSLNSVTREVIKKIEPARPVYIQAYISPEVPSNYVQTRETLLKLLRAYEAMGGSRISVKVTDTERYTPAAREAEENFGIKPEPVADFEEGRRNVDAVFLGVAFRCGAEEVVVPFLHRGLSVEYELTRSIGVVSGAGRKKVGVLANDAKVFGGMDFQTMSSQSAWRIVDELKKQYEVVRVGTDRILEEKCDVLFVPMPSSLAQKEMDDLQSYITRGGPALLLDDPEPLVNMGLAPREPKQGGRGMGMFGGPPPTEPKGDIRRLMDAIGVSWSYDDVAWDVYNPHPTMKDLPREFVFVGPGSGVKDAFHPEDPVSSGLQEMVLLCPGRLAPLTGTPLTFTPLLKTTPQSGVLLSSEIFQRSFFGFGWNPNRVHRTGGTELTLAARLRGTRPAEGSDKPAESWRINVILVADLDFVSDQFFQLREDGSLTFDNVTFILNCVDVLAGDESFVTIRKRRLKHRTLETVEALKKKHTDDELKQTRDAGEAAKKKLQEAQDRMNEAVERIRKRTDLDERARNIYLGTVEDVETRKLEVARTKIEDEKTARIERSKVETAQAVKAIEARIKILAAVLPPIPVILIGLFVFLARRRRESGGVA